MHSKVVAMKHTSVSWNIHLITDHIAHYCDNYYDYPN